MKKLLYLFLLIFAISTSAQSRKSGDYTVTIKILSSQKTSGELMGSDVNFTDYEGTYILYKKNEKIAEQGFSAMDMKNGVSVNIKMDERLGTTVFYDTRTDRYEYMSEEKKIRKSDSLEDRILNSILYYAELTFSGKEN